MFVCCSSDVCCPWRPEEDTRSPDQELQMVGNRHVVLAGMEPGSSEKQPVISTTEPPLYPLKCLHVHIYICIYIMYFNHIFSHYPFFSLTPVFSLSSPSSLSSSSFLPLPFLHLHFLLLFPLFFFCDRMIFITVFFFLNRSTDKLFLLLFGISLAKRYRLCVYKSLLVCKAGFSTLHPLDLDTTAFF